MRVCLPLGWTLELQHDPLIFWCCIIVLHIVKQALSPHSLVNILVFCYQISTPSSMLGVHSCLWGTATCVLSLPAYPAFIFSVCFDGNYLLWMQETRGEKNLSFLAIEHTSRLWVFLARLPPQIFGAPVGFALQSLIAARGECVVVSYGRQVQLNNPPLQRQAFSRAFSSHVCYCQPPK